MREVRRISQKKNQLLWSQRHLEYGPKKRKQREHVWCESLSLNQHCGQKRITVFPGCHTSITKSWKNCLTYTHKSPKTPLHHSHYIHSCIIVYHPFPFAWLSVVRPRHMEKRDLYMWPTGQFCRCSVWAMGLMAQRQASVSIQDSMESWMNDSIMAWLCN